MGLALCWALFFHTMSNPELNEINRHCTPKTLWVVTVKGKLLIINCPFEVVAIKSVGVIKAGKKHQVQEVKITEQYILVYIIEGAAYYYYFFKIFL